VTRVCALVVTRNRKRLLAECLNGLLKQSHPLAQVIVFDNASTDGTAEWLDAGGLLRWPALRLVRSEVNQGGAGGYAEGLRLCLSTGADWIWLMDDDSEPRPDALERLLTSPVARNSGVAALCTSVVHSDGSIDPLHRCRLGRFVRPLAVSAYAVGTYARVDCASFVGLLLRGRVVRDISPPRQEFFLGYDDAEYSLRVWQWGDIRLVPEAVMTHKISIGGGERTRRSTLSNRLLGQHYSAAPWNTYWKDLYRIRNFIVLRDLNGLRGVLELSVLIAGYVAKALLYDSRPLRRVPWIVRYALKGWREDFSGPTPAQWTNYAGARDRPPPRRARASNSRPSPR
jgi:rhamnopyranosyl-N-acetylglucosaminyl-diphospho-decaprenol beta-1,3/1,4-galactofuranosyltransferase